LVLTAASLREAKTAQQIVSANEVEAHPVSEWGHVDVDGHFRPVGQALGATAFGLNQLELAPEAKGPVHDHRQDGQQEIYLVIRGRGTIRIDGHDHELQPGQFIFLPPEAERQMVAGTDGLAWLGIGCKPGAYAPP
jgi:quercetin dioxygenase-like cupin family protein